jgi:hypothetical protein
MLVKGLWMCQSTYAWRAHERPIPVFLVGRRSAEMSALRQKRTFKLTELR